MQPADLNPVSVYREAVADVLWKNLLLYGVWKLRAAQKLVVKIQ